MVRLKNLIASNYKKLSAFLFSAFLMFSVLLFPVLASDINNSPIVKGTEKLINDTTTWLTVLFVSTNCLLAML